MAGIRAPGGQGCVGNLAGCDHLVNQVLPALLTVVEISFGVVVGVVGTGYNLVVQLLHFSGTCMLMLLTMSPP